MPFPQVTQTLSCLIWVGMFCSCSIYHIYISFVLVHVKSVCWGMFLFVCWFLVPALLILASGWSAMFYLIHSQNYLLLFVPTLHQVNSWSLVCKIYLSSCVYSLISHFILQWIFLQAAFSLLLLSCLFLSWWTVAWLYLIPIQITRRLHKRHQATIRRCLLNINGWRNSVCGVAPVWTWDSSSMLPIKALSKTCFLIVLIFWFRLCS